MKFFIQKIFFKNRAPFDNLDIDLLENEIAVLTAANGRGKTTVLSHIADAFHELAKISYGGTFEGKEHKYYRVSQAVDNLIPDQPSVFYMRASLDGQIVDYVNVRGSLTEEAYNSILLENKLDYSLLVNALATSNTVKYTTLQGDIKKAEALFGGNLITYFPSYRFEKPGYINAPYETKITFRKYNSYSGILTNPLEVVSGLEALANWLMDIALDMQYESSNVNILKRNVDGLITLILGGKLKRKLRYGVGPRGYGHTRIQIMDEDSGESIYPTIFNLSAGEAAALCIFGELIRQSDNINNNTVISDAVGVVLIDEVDKHLHIKLQKEVLPVLFALFPNVQFIIASHSPFLSMGLAEGLSNRTKIVDLDSFGITRDPTTNELYSEVYEMMVNDSNRIREEYIKLKDQIKQGNIPLIVTEGKTDIQHIRKAKKVINIVQEFDYFNVPADWGDSKLKLLLEQLSKVPQGRKVIGIFDRDVPEIVKSIEENGQQYKSFGNNVYGICLPIPAGKEQYTNISIEFLYHERDLLKEHEGRRLHFDNEVRFYQPGDRKGRAKPEKMTLPDESKEFTKKIFDTDVGDLPDAHSKSVFANLIENNEAFCDGVSFDNFLPIFDKIKNIIKADF